MHCYLYWSFIVTDYSLAPDVLVLTEGVCIFLIRFIWFNAQIHALREIALAMGHTTQFYLFFFFNNQLLIVNMPKNQDGNSLIYSSVSKV